MFKLAIVPLALLMAGCMHSPDSTYMGDVPSSGNVQPQAANIEYLSAYLVRQLTQQLPPHQTDGNILVTTPVLVANLEDTNHLGLSLQQSLMSHFKQQGHNVVDANLAVAMQVSKQGDFMLSRDWQRLSQEMLVQYVMVTTLSPSADSVLVNSRILDKRTNRILAASQTHITAAQLPNYIKTTEQVTINQGKLSRGVDNAQQAVTFLGGKS